MQSSEAFLKLTVTTIWYALMSPNIHRFSRGGGGAVFDCTWQGWTFNPKLGFHHLNSRCLVNECLQPSRRYDCWKPGFTFHVRRNGVNIYQSTKNSDLISSLSACDGKMHEHKRFRYWHCDEIWTYLRFLTCKRSAGPEGSWPTKIQSVGPDIIRTPHIYSHEHKQCTYLVIEFIFW